MALCYYCEREFARQPKSRSYLRRTTDHIIPKDNLLDACSFCNELKGNLFLEDFEQLLEYRIRALEQFTGNQIGKWRVDLLRTILKNVKLLIEKIRPYREKLFKNYAKTLNKRP